MPSPEELERQAREIARSQPPSLLAKLIESGEIPVVTLANRMNELTRRVEMLRGQEANPVP